MTETVVTRPQPPSTVPAVQRRRLPAGWPIALAVGGYPLWWALGVTPLVFPLAAVPLAWELVRRGRVRLPPGGWLWALFLVCVLVSGAALDVTAEGTIPPSGTGRYVAYAFRFLNYLAITVVLLYVGNATEESLPRARVVRWMAVLGLFTVGLGVASVLYPHFGFRTPVSMVLPGPLRELVASDGGSHVSLAQVQPVLGEESPRPAAPFAFTNAWGNNLSLLLVWVVAAGWNARRRWIRAGTAALLLVATVPIVFSLNRGMWIGLGLSVLYVAVRLAARGRLLALAAIAVVLSLSAAAFVASPLQHMVSERLSAGHSNDVRGSLALDAIKAAADSPIIGYGSTRATIGSDSSIAIGKSPDCPKCGNRNIGSTGQLWLLLIAQGFLGAGLYLAFFVRIAWAYRHDASPLGIAGSLVVLLSLFYAFLYTALLMPLVLTFLSIALLWRNSLAREGQASQRRGAAMPA